jgi:hypothetical protein
MRAGRTAATSADWQALNRQLAPDQLGDREEPRVREGATTARGR